MVRVVKSAEVRQDEILDVAQRLFMTRGYDQTSIQQIIDEVGIAKGTFYHHYPSKPALLDALVARLTAASLELVAPLLADPSVGAVAKLNDMFLQIGAWKAGHRALLTEVHRAMHRDENALLLTRIQRDATNAMVPMLAQVIRQGVNEGVFDTRYPDQAARIVLELGITLGRVVGDSLLEVGPPPTEAEVRSSLEAYDDAVTRVLGAPPGAIRLTDIDMIVQFLLPEGRAEPAERSA